jgi:hypothetical protein
LRSLSCDHTEGHWITLVEEDGREYLWMADNGKKRLRSLNYEYPPESALKSGRVVKMDLEGHVIQ